VELINTQLIPHFTQIISYPQVALQWRFEKVSSLSPGFSENFASPFFLCYVFIGSPYSLK